MYRSHTCGELRLQHQQQSVQLAGWVQTIRALGNITFIDIRDHFGITQLVVTESVLHALSKPLGREFVIQAQGKVIPRKNKNPQLPTGDIEVEVSSLRILNASKTPPFTIIDDTDGGEDLRMKYRYLDLRRPKLQKNLILRTQLAQLIRSYLVNLQFNEIETPFLIKSTPEGARDFIIPSRVNPQQFYALPQSPQTFKQLLMIAGYDRYFQIVRCFRDEDLRADRQPEFTQLDCEMTFVEQEDIMHTFEQLLIHILKAVKGISLTTPILRLTYEEAMRDYGNDKPDLRFDMKIQNLKVNGKTHLPCIQETLFPIFQQAESILGLVVPQGSSFSRKEIEQLTEWVKRPQLGMKGMVYIKWNEQGLTSSIDKFFTPQQLKELTQHTHMNKGDMLLLLAGEDTLTRKATSELRLQIAQQLNLLNTEQFAMLWVTDFPLFFRHPETHILEPCHHPFTAPKEEDLNKLNDTKQLEHIKAQAYDLVLNGTEIGGGSIRIHDRKIQERIFQLLNISDEERQAKFGFILEAFEYGAPPHGGIAFGFDRICALLCGTTSIRDVMAFPKNNNGRDVMLDTPSTLDTAQLNELHIQVKG